MENEYCIQSRNTAAGLQMDNASISSSRYDVMEQSCGWSKCKPKKLQKLNSPKWFLFFLAVFSVAQGINFLKVNFVCFICDKLRDAVLKVIRNNVVF